MSAITVRPLTPRDAPLLRHGDAHLSPQSRRRRFLGARRALTDAELRRLLAVDHWHHEALVALAGARPLGVARYVRGADFETAEIAVAVVDEWQRRGVGSTLLDALLARARPAGIRRLAAALELDNGAAWRLLRAIGEPVALRLEAGVAEVVVDLGPPGAAHGPDARRRPKPPRMS